MSKRWLDPEDESCTSYVMWTMYEDQEPHHTKVPAPHTVELEVFDGIRAAHLVEAIHDKEDAKQVLRGIGTFRKAIDDIEEYVEKHFKVKQKKRLRRSF